MASQPAVVVRNAYKYYGSKNDKKIILNHLNMNVEKGTIYGLLGPSGCGKTTLLSCVVGRRSMQSGQVQVLGGAARTAVASRIGYMPQDVALVGEFSMKDAIFFFGRIYGMSESRIEERVGVLTELLDLPEQSRLIKNMSGGQQRRVSFAAALVHEPELLILDEPTCGLDPVLRDRIWNYLVDISVNNGVAVIITTHYIEETRQAQRIGLMRGGRLLAEESPDSLMARFECETLEDAFLILSIKQSKTEGGGDEPNVVEACGDIDTTPIDIDAKPIEPDLYYNSTNSLTGSRDILTNTKRKKIPKSTGMSKFKALFIKNIQQFGRHPGGLIFALAFPIVQMLAFMLSVGHDPREIRIGIVNDEVPNYEDCLNLTGPTAVFNPEDYTCSYNKLSCRYIKSLDESVVVKTFYKDKDSAFRAVQKGIEWGTIYIAKNYSESTRERIEEGRYIDNFSMEASQITCWLDMSNHQIGHFVKKKLYSDYIDFAKTILKDCDSTVKQADIPVNFKDPIYGSKEALYSFFMLPGVMATILFFLATTVTSTLIIYDRLEGVWDRIVVAGVHSGEILTVHILIQTIVIAVQTVEVMVVAFLGYQVPYKGDIMTAAVLLFLQGVSGMCFGFLVSVICNSYSLSFFISTGSFYPMILLCGILWPLEGMTGGLRYVSSVMPFTIPIQSLRNVIDKGYDITHVNVYDGYLVTFAWIIFLTGSCYVILRLKKA